MRTIYYTRYIRKAYPNELCHGYANELYHHGIKGQKWGVRRFQNPDGTLTAAGKKRYYKTGVEPDTGRAYETLTPKGEKLVDKIHRNSMRDAASYAKTKGYKVKPISKDTFLISSKIDDKNEFQMDISPFEASTTTDSKGNRIIKTLDSRKKELRNQIDLMESNKKVVASKVKNIRNQMMAAISKEYQNPLFSEEWQEFGKNINFDNSKMSITSYGPISDRFQVRMPLIENAGGVSPAYRNGEVWYADVEFDKNGKPKVYGLEWSNY